jgi:hypothetical protein
MPQVQEFHGIDRAKWTRIQALITKETGIPVNQDSGDDKKDGVEISWKYSEADSSLAVTLIKREFFDPSDTVIEGDITKLVQSA